MPQNYYPNSTNYPAIILAVAERVKYHICTLLYPQEDYITQSSKRFILASFEAGTDVAIKRAIEKFKNSQSLFPFTAYNIGELTPVTDKRSHRQKNFTYYSPFLNAYVSAQPSELEMPMMSFFTTPNDYFRALTILHTDEVNLTRLETPILINGVLTSFTIDLNFEIGKGDLAYSFEDYLKMGKIYNISHNVKIYFHNIVLDTEIFPVDNIEISLFKLSEKNTGVLIKEEDLPDPPSVISTAPSNKETNVDIDNPIIIYFSTSMNEESVEENLSILPYIDYNTVWNSSGTVLVIDPLNPMDKETTYNIIINKEATSSLHISFENSFELSFTTGEI